MKTLTSLQELKKETGSNENVWLLLFKKGSAQSDCAFGNFEKAGEIAAGRNKNNVLCTADVNEVRDIHPEFGVTSVPSLLHFEKGELRNLVKGCHQPEQFNIIFDKSAVATPVNGEKKRQKNVTVYTTPTCTWCNTIKRYLQENGIRYREVDVSRDQKAAEEMVRRSGQQGVPQTDINGEMIVGFDKARINNLLGIN
jgi:glutaredoxin-like YruB-family protein